MSEQLHDKKQRKELLKHMIRQLHDGQAPDQVRPQLVRLLGQVPYDEVVAVEQELINEGLPPEEVLKLCDIHHEAMGTVDTEGAPTAPAGHPVHTFQQENQALVWEIQGLTKLFAELAALPADALPKGEINSIRARFNAIMDVEKHYLRKENLLFPFLEKAGITGPPTVMWGKHDEAREFLKSAIAGLKALGEANADEVCGVIELLLRPAAEAVSSMIDKEEQILLPMCLDTLSDEDWYSIYRESGDYGYCLYVPEESWRPEGIAEAFVEDAAVEEKRIQLPTGSFSPAELEVVLNNIPFDVTFVDAEDTVRYFSHGRERIFARSKAILGRKVQYCHPPSSVDTVQRILDDFHAGRQSQAAFWIEMGGQFISIEYFALRNDDGKFLGTLEVSQNLTEKRALSGERRLLKYDDDTGGGDV
ncbi:MAG: DUF438 domain-containing protein [bacterium]|nr:DUF438 domain-containing protein [bacterium]